MEEELCTLKVERWTSEVQMRGLEGESRTSRFRAVLLMFKVHGLKGNKKTPVSWLQS